MVDPLSNVAVIGAGLGGCALALAFTQHQISVTVYETRPQSAEAFHSGVLLTPNGLQVLDRLGVLPRIHERCFKPTHRVLKNSDYETTRKTLVADKSLSGYSNHRVWRRILLDEMKAMLAEKTVPIHYDSKFKGIVSDTDDGVKFTINDSVYEASLLVGSDGIHSTVRDYIHPGVVPKYTGLVAVLSHIKTASVDWPADQFEPNATIQGKPGALFYLAEDPDYETIMTGIQINYPEKSRSEMDKAKSDHDAMAAMYRKGYEEWGPTARSFIDSVTASKENCFMWPYVKVPFMDRWYSPSGRVLILGDAAHGLPPSTGQGVNQALEDVYSLTLLFAALKGTLSMTNGAVPPRGHDLVEILEFWQKLRQARVDAIFEWTQGNEDVNRLAEKDRQKLIDAGKFKHGQADDPSWLYRPRLAEDVQAWLSGREVAA